MIASGLFVRFGEVFEGFLPARRLHGEYFELNDLATAMAGRTTGRTYRLGGQPSPSASSASLATTARWSSRPRDLIGRHSRGSRLREEAGMEFDTAHVWITTRRLKPGAREEFSRSWRPREFPEGMLRAYECYSPDGT